MKDFKIKSININGIGGINKLYLEFQDGMNIICGSNGVGKTTILECISHAFVTTSTTVLKRNVNVSQGTCALTFKDGSKNEPVLTAYTLQSFNPTGQRDFVNALSNESINILFFTERRSINYSELTSIPKDPDKMSNNTASDAYNGVSASDIKAWFIQRDMWSPHRDYIQDEQLNNLSLAKEVFRVLDSEVSFSRIDINTNDIMVKTKQGEVYFEYLSSGYKSCVYVLLGIIKEIEFRFKNPCINVGDFSGIILIDEIDVHLHPQWQESLVHALRVLFPKAQIIATTHSPSIIQCAEAHEIIPLEFDENNNVAVKKLNAGEYGFQGWSIEEILTDVMGMKTIRSDLFTSTLKAFDKAIDEGNAKKARESYVKLDKMLHPSNYLRKLLEISMIGIGKND